MLVLVLAVAELPQLILPLAFDALSSFRELVGDPCSSFLSADIAFGHTLEMRANDKRNEITDQLSYLFIWREVRACYIA